MLTLQFVPYSDIERLDADGRVEKLLGIVKEEKIVLMQGRLRVEEETLLIQRTLEKVGEGFPGIELCTIYPEERELRLLGRMKKEMTKALLGNRDGVTIIGPATVVKEIRKDPQKMMMFTLVTASSPRRKRSGSRRVVRRRVRARKRRR